MLKFLDQANLNTLAIVVLLLIILFFVSNTGKAIKNYYSRLRKDDNDFKIYLATQAKIRTVESAPNAILAIDANGIIVSWNLGAFSMFQYKESEILGKELNIIIPTSLHFSFDANLGSDMVVMNTGENIPVGKTTIVTAVRKDGSSFPAEITIWKWMSESQTIYYSSFLLDKTVEHNEKENLIDSLTLFLEAEKIGDMGSWSWDVLEDKIVISKNYSKIFNVQGNKLDSLALIKRVYYEDRKYVETTIKNSFDKKTGYVMCYRVVDLDGSLIYIKSHSEAYLNENGELIKLQGIAYKLNPEEYNKWQPLK